MAYTGTLKKFMDGKGFGFIENSDGSGDVFVHFSQLTNGGSDDMIVGTEMTFDIEEDPPQWQDQGNQRYASGWWR